MIRRITYKVFWLALILGLPGSQTYGVNCEDAYVGIFKETFSSSDYVKGECQANACRLLGRLKDAGEPLDNSKVLFFLGTLAPRNPRSFFVEWPYHTIVVHRGVVLDMDYGQQATPLEEGDYLRKNWIPKSFDSDPAVQSHVGSSVKVVEVPALEFLSGYPLQNDTREARQEFIQSTVSHREVIPLNEYLGRVEALP